MTKVELVAAVAEKAGISKKAAGAAVAAYVDVVTETLANGEKVVIPGFGTFEVSERSERTGRNPATGEEITIAASKSPKFKAGSALKQAVKG